MESVAIRDQRNKENVAPVSAKENNPVPANAPSFKKKKKSSKGRLRRKPLADITNLFHSSAPSILAQQNTSFPSRSSSSNSTESDPRKRTMPVVCDSAQRLCSKSLRMGFR